MQKEHFSAPMGTTTFVGTSAPNINDGTGIGVVAPQSSGPVNAQGEAWGKGPEEKKEQHEKIAGYKKLSDEEIAMMNDIKAVASQVGLLMQRLGQYHNAEMQSVVKRGQLAGAQGFTPDEQAFLAEGQRWTSEGAMTLQTGFMQLTRSVTRPKFF